MTDDKHGKWKRWKPTLLIALAGTIGLAAVFGWFFPRARDEARRASGKLEISGAFMCASSFARDNGGTLPPLDSEPGRMMFGRSYMFPKHCSNAGLVTIEADRSIPFSPSKDDLAQADFLDDHSMYYLGYFLENEVEGLEFVERYRAQVSTGGDFNSDLDASPGKGSFGLDEFIRLSDDTGYLVDLLEMRNDRTESVDRLRERIPVFIERPEHYRQPGGFVAYLDGRVRWHDYPGEWPMTKRFIEALESLDRLGPDSNY